jgi:hypothetical protein
MLEEAAMTHGTNVTFVMNLETHQQQLGLSRLKEHELPPRCRYIAMDYFQFLRCIRCLGDLHAFPFNAVNLSCAHHFLGAVFFRIRMVEASTICFVVGGLMNSISLEPGHASLYRRVG